jgi:predicted  nucleic acid-binding Zn-ribbon protein
MGPSNVALVSLFRAEQALREAKVRLDDVTKDVRHQEIRRKTCADNLAAAQARSMELQSKVANLDLEVKARDAHIEKLRQHQTLADNNKEYQALLVEINTNKVDRAKLEEQLIKVMEQAETAATEVTNISAMLVTENAKLAEMQSHLGDKATAAQAEVERLTPDRVAAAAKIKPAILAEFDRLANRYEGEALAQLEKPDPRDPEYLCTGCNMSLVPDVFNKLKTRDDPVTCPSCRRFLYLPENAVYETVVPKRGGTKGKSNRVVKKVVKSADAPVVPESKWSKIVVAAQGESARDASEADQKPVECTVEINGDLVGTFKGKSSEHLERVIKFRLEEAKMSAEVKVALIGAAAPVAAPAPASPAAETAATTSSV